MRAHAILRAGLIALLMILAGALPAASQGRAESWRELLAGGDQLNLSHAGGQLTLGGQERRQRHDQRRFGTTTFPARRLGLAANRFQASVDAATPPGAALLVEVRVQADDGRWSEWREATATKPALTPFAATTAQVRLTLFDDGQGHGPAVRNLQLTADQAPLKPLADQAPLTYTVYATREGLVGNTTANGHVVQRCDRFVALPSHRVTSSKDGSEYQVQITNPKNGRTVIVPVWDIGPWNIHDDYWNPSDVREMWQDLPQGKPEAQAARQDGYNGGRDEFGRMVEHPNGIDIADGTFWEDLGLIEDGWVQVTYLWTGTSTAQTKHMLPQATSGMSSTTYLPLVSHVPWSITIDNIACSKFLASASWGTSSYNAQNYGGNYRYATPQPVSDAAWFQANIPLEGSYEIFAWYPASSAYNTATPYVIVTPSGNQVVYVNQQLNGGQWNSLGVFTLGAGMHDVVGVSRWTSAAGYVIADAIMIVRSQP